MMFQLMVNHSKEIQMHHSLNAIADHWAGDTQATPAQVERTVRALLTADARGSRPPG